MTEKNKTYPRRFYILRSGLTVNIGEDRDPRHRVMYRGDTFEVTEEEYEASKDLKGRSWLDMTPEDQEARWGNQNFGEGDLPEGIEWADDDLHGQVYRQWQAATERAKKISDPAERAQAYADIKRKFPQNYGSSQRTIREY